MPFPVRRKAHNKPTPQLRTHYSRAAATGSKPLWSDPMTFDVRDMSNTADTTRNFTEEELDAVLDHFKCPIIDAGAFVVVEKAPKHPVSQPTRRGAPGALPVQQLDDPQPFTVGGKLAFFWDQATSLPYGLGIVGDFASNNEDYRLSSAEATAELRTGQIPSLQTLACIYECVPDAIYVSWYNHTILLEFPELPLEEHKHRLQKVPCKISGVKTASINGLWKLAAQGSRGITPDPSIVNGIYADTDYYPHNLQPGVLLVGDNRDSTDECLTTSGIVLRKSTPSSSIRRLTVAEHGFSETTNSVYHPNTNGTLIGSVVERIPDTDIGLADIGDLKYSNKAYFGVEQEIVGLARASELRHGHTYVFDSFVTGQQRVMCMGVRAKPQERGRKKYMCYKQGIFASGTAIIPTKPQIRDGACGAVLVGEDCPVRGKIGGFHVWVDVKGYDSSLLCLCEVCDPLIDAGWEVEV